MTRGKMALDYVSSQFHSYSPSEELKAASLPIAYQKSLFIAAQNPLRKGAEGGVRTVYLPLGTTQTEGLRSPVSETFRSYLIYNQIHTLEQLLYLF